MFQPSDVICEQTTQSPAVGHYCADHYWTCCSQPGKPFIEGRISILTPGSAGKCGQRGMCNIVHLGKVAIAGKVPIKLLYQEIRATLDFFISILSKMYLVK